MLSLPHVSIGGVRVATASRTELTAAMVEDCRSQQKRGLPRVSRLVFDANGHGISLAATDPEYRRALEQADIVHADGGFIVTISRWLAGTKIRERSATTDLIHDFAAAAAANGLSFYLLGGTEEVNAECAERMRRQYPHLRIAGRHHGYFAASAEGAVAADISRSGADIVWVGLGKPGEQCFAVRNRDRLGSCWVVTCGGCFNYITGAYGRAPRWMQRVNLEWLYRAASSPKLLWRYGTTSPHALWVTFTKIDRRTFRSARG